MNNHKKNCKKEGYDEEYCIKRNNNFDKVTYEASWTKINAETICNKIGLCNKYKYVEDTNEEYFQRVLHDKPPKI